VLAFVVVFAVSFLVSLDLVRGENPDSYYYCGKNPLKPVPSIPPLETTDANLIQVEVLIRHGDRSSFAWYSPPASLGTRKQCWPGDTAAWNCTVNYLTYPGLSRVAPSISQPDRLYRKLYDNDKNILAGNCDVGQLTSKGYHQQIVNGKMIRNYYVDKMSFLPENITEDNLSTFYIRSDDVPRTVMSAEGLLQGLYPVEPNITRPLMVDIHTRSLDLSVLTVNPTLCPRIGQVLEEAMQSANYTQFIQNTVVPLVNKLSNILGVTVPIDHIDDLVDCSNGYFCHNFPLHSGIDLSIIQIMESAAVWIENYINSYPTPTYNAKRGIGFLIAEMYGHLDAKLRSYRSGQPSDEPNFLLWSGHDTSIMPFLMAYGLPPTQWVAYASVLIIELYDNPEFSSGAAIRMIYNQEALSIPGCGGTLCDWGVFSGITQSLITTNYLRDCATQ